MVLLGELEGLTLRDRCAGHDGNLVPLLRSVALIVYEELLGLHLELLVLRVHDVARYRNGSRVLHGRLYDDSLKMLWLCGGLFHSN